MDEKEVIPFKTSPVLPIFEKFSKARDVSLVYGDAIEVHGRTIIPVAKVEYSVGAGAGSGYARDDKDPASSHSEEVGGGRGEGAGGAFQVKPVGIYDITADKTVYRPIVPVELIILVPLMVTGLAFLMANKQDKSDRMDPKRGRMRNGSRCKNKRQGKKMKDSGHSE